MKTLKDCDNIVEVEEALLEWLEYYEDWLEDHDIEVEEAQGAIAFIKKFSEVIT